MVNKFSYLEGYRNITNKYFLYTNNKNTEKKIVGTVQFTITLKKIKKKISWKEAKYIDDGKIIELSSYQ